MANYGGEESSSFAYDVFLSFRGEDTRHTFIGYLRKELWRKAIKTFADDNDEDMRIGEGISPSLSQAIEESKIYVVVLSENYASSTWCLWELVKILECKKGDNKRHVFPIFYHVDPSDVRHQRNSYGKAMKAHENRFGENSEKVQRWKSALSEIASLKGLHLTTGSEINFIEKIVETVLAEIPPKNIHVSQDPVGLEHRIEEVMSLLDIKSNDDTVSMLGIYGLGGVGKTEIVKALYNKIVHQFEAASFLENVREKSKKINGLEDLQKILLSEMREESKSKFGSTSKGIKEIKCKLNKKKVLLVLDDIDDREQLDNLAGDCDWFGSGSRIIITTRDKDLLGYPIKKVYEMKELNEQHSLELFCQNTFGKSHPKIGYENMSSRAVCYAMGLPLALKVIASDLATQKSVEAWECALEEYKRIPKSRIQDKLKISYDRLEDNAKSVFLDIACFFKGESIQYVKKILEEFNATHNIEVLVNKSLLTVENGCLKMHDLIQDMGREIVRQEAPNPGKRSRLWFYEDVVEVLTEDSGSDAIQGIMLDPPQREEVEWSGTAFEKMKYLRILIVRNTSFSSGPMYLSNYLRLLDWEEYPSKYFPPKFYPKKIILFNLSKSYLEQQEPFKKFSYLTSMNFSWNQSLTAIPDVSELQALIHLRLDHCENLIEVHESVGFLKKLALLDASRCTKLINFPRRMFLPSLEVLYLDLCVRLEHFPEIVNKMEKSLQIHMKRTAIKELPDSIDNLIGHVWINMSRNKKLRYLPSSFFKMQNLTVLKIQGCPHLREYFRRFVQNPSAINDRPTLRKLDFENGGLSDEDLHVVLNCFPKLEYLIVSLNNFVSLPECIKEFVHLRSLDVRWCMKLEHMGLPSTIQKVNATNCFSLTRETLIMLWSQVSKEIRGLQIKMPQCDIPEWFDFKGNGGNPHLWAREKFPIFALALVFQDENDIARVCFSHRIDLQLVINGQFVARKGTYRFSTIKDNVLVFDLRLLFDEEEWLGLEAFLEHDWNLVQVLYDSRMTLSSWGVFVYKQETNMEDVRFMCPDPKYSYIANISHAKFLPPTNPKLEQMKKEIESWVRDKMFFKMIMKCRDSQELLDLQDDFLRQIRNSARTLMKKWAKENGDESKFRVSHDRSIQEEMVEDTVMEFREQQVKQRKRLKLSQPLDVGEASTF